MNENNLQFLEEVVNTGFAIIPGIPNRKIPAMKWSTEYINTVDKVRPTFQDKDYNVAVVCGKSFDYGVLVIDCDTNEKGEPKPVKLVYNKLDKDNKFVPEVVKVLKWEDELLNTFTIKTRSNGRHFYYKLKEKTTEHTTVNMFGDNVDVRGRKGISWFPPSQVDGKSYTIENNTDLQYLPYELEKVIKDSITRCQMTKEELNNNLKGTFTTLKKSDQQKVALEALKYIDSEADLTYPEWFGIYCAVYTVFDGNKNQTLNVMSEWSDRFTKIDEYAVNSIKMDYFTLGTIIHFAQLKGYKYVKPYPVLTTLFNRNK